MKIIGLDLSLTATGVYNLNNPTGYCIKSKHKGMKRIYDIVNAIETEFDNEKFDDAFIIIEGYSFGAQGSRIFDIAELGGCVKYMLYNTLNNYDEQVLIVPPMTLKKFVTGKGLGNKNVMMLHAFKRWGVEFDDDNICDAFCLAKFGQTYLKWKQGEKVLKYEEECFKKLNK